MARSPFALASLLLLACASPGASGRTSGAPVADRGATPRAEPGVKIVCQMEKITGSNIPEKVCYRVLDDTERDRARDAAQDALRAPHAPNRTGG